MSGSLGPILFAFSSYARELRHTVAPKNELVEDGLRDAFVPAKVSLYLDTDERTGVKTGSWPVGIVDAIARSSVFIWWQSPSWFVKATCRWEFDCFLARADGIARQLDAPADKVRTWLIEPIHMAAMTKPRWDRLPEDARAHRTYYETLNRQAELDVTAGGRELDLNKCLRGMHHFHDQLVDELEPYGGIAGLLAVEPEGPAFKRLWVEFARERRIWSDYDPVGSAALDMSSPSQLRQRLNRQFGRDMAAATIAGTIVACTARSLRGGGYYPVAGSRTLTGQDLWDETAADECDDCARSVGLRLPTREEAARILDILTGPTEQRQRTGFEETASDIWCRERSGELSVAKGSAKRAPIFLVPDRLP